MTVNSVIKKLLSLASFIVHTYAFTYNIFISEQRIKRIEKLKEFAQSLDLVTRNFQRSIFL